MDCRSFGSTISLLRPAVAIRLTMEIRKKTKVEKKGREKNETPRASNQNGSGFSALVFPGFHLPSLHFPPLQLSPPLAGVICSTSHLAGGRGRSQQRPTTHQGAAFPLSAWQPQVGTQLPPVMSPGRAERGTAALRLGTSAPIKKPICSTN